MTDKATFTRAQATGDLQSLVTSYNANLDTLEVALDDSLSLSGKLPNSLTAPLDMNSQRMINLADAVESSDAVTKRQLDAIVAGEVSFSDVASLTFDTTSTDANAVGRLVWNDTDGTLDLGLKGGNVTMQIGQEMFARVVNKTGSDFLEANYQVVRIDGAQGQRLKVTLAQANSTANVAGTLGLVTETIANNAEGFVTTMGLVRGINTSGYLQGETWSDGDTLYLSQGTAGRLTKTKPTSGIVCKVGYVEYAHATQGRIFVHVENFAGLQETLVSGTNIKTLNGTSLLGSGDIVISGGGSGTTTNALSVNDDGTGTAPDFTFNGSAARIISFNSVGAVGLTSNQTVAGDKTFSGTTALASTSTVDGITIGYRNIPRVTDALTEGKCFATTTGVTISTGSAAGTTYSIYNNTSADITITQGSGLTLRVAGTATTGNYTLPQRGFITIWYNSTTEAIIL